MNESMDRSPRVPLSTRVEQIVSAAGLADTKNNFFQFSMLLRSERLWSEVKSASTFEEYVQSKYGTDPSLIEAVLARSDESFVENFNSYTQRINIAIADGVTTEEQAQDILSLSRDAMAYIDEYCAQLRDKLID